MSAIIGLLKELAGLFVDDGALALALVAVIGVAAVFAAIMPGALAAGAVLIAGSIAVLFVNVAAAARR